MDAVNNRPRIATGLIGQSPPEIGINAQKSLDIAPLEEKLIFSPLSICIGINAYLCLCHIRGSNTQEKLGLIHPRSLEEAMKYAEIIAKSGLAPNDYHGKPASVLVAIQIGAEVGLSPIQALQNIAVINGRPSLWGDALLAVVQSHPHCEDIIEEFDNNTMTASCTVKRRGRKTVTRTFCRKDAEAAGLWGKCGADGKLTPWVTYPKRMLYISFVVARPTSTLRADGN